LRKILGDVSAVWPIPLYDRTLQEVPAYWMISTLTLIDISKLSTTQVEWLALKKEGRARNAHRSPAIFSTEALISEFNSVI
jgi:hypothetical protein